MKIQFNYHGKLAELLGKKSEHLDIQSQNSAELQEEMKKTYPALASSTFQLAQSNRILAAEAVLEEKSIDLFPPFSGG